MKPLACVLTVLAFVATAQAQDTYRTDASSATAEPTGQAMAAPTPAPMKGTVPRAAITHAIEDREPVDNLAKVTTDTGKLYYFTELSDMEGQTVTHRWEHNGETMAEVEFDVGGPRWRVYSSKNLMPEWTGQWRVSVVDAAGNTVRGDTFMYVEAPEAVPDSSGMSQDSVTGADDMKTGMSGGR